MLTPSEALVPVLAASTVMLYPPDVPEAVPSISALRAAVVALIVAELEYAGCVRPRDEQSRCAGYTAYSNPYQPCTRCQRLAAWRTLL